MYEILPRVFFGGAGVTHNPKAMLRAGITCYMGWNRSAALAIAYTCSTTGRPAAPLIEEVCAASGSPILTNAGFVAQLQARFPGGS